MAVIDWFEFILPDWGTFGLLVAGLAYGLFLSPYSITHHLFGMLFGGLFSFCIQFLYSKFRKREGLGWGDVKLLAAAGAWLGGAGILSLLIEASITALAVSYLMAAVRGRRVEMKQKLAYGPYLCGAFWITWLFGPLEFL
jgi:leader peptidase (prepilin peptidase)/N-methyltransferase